MMQRDFIELEKELPPDCRVVLVKAYESKGIGGHFRTVLFTAYLHRMDMTWHSTFPTIGVIQTIKEADAKKWLKIESWAYLD